MGFKDFVKKLETEHQPGLTSSQLFLQNYDLQPIEPERRKWGFWNFVAFWVADSFNINTWQIAATGVADGLAWWHVWLTVWFGYATVGVFITLIGRIGAVYHIPFPVASRSAFGISGSYWPVINRAVMACVWYGVQAWLGGQCVQLMILAIWPQAKNIHNGIPNSGTTTFEFMCFFLFCFGSLPALWFPVEKIRHLFTVKSYLVPIAGIAFLIWTIKKAGGIGPIVHQPATLEGSDLAWAVVKSFMNCLANFAALIINDPDFTRFSTTRRSYVWSQALTIPIGFALTSFIGIIVSSSSTLIVGKTLWSPLAVLGAFLNNGSGGARTGVFLISSVFTLAQLGTNIAANSISAGTDLTALFPRFFNIRRGSYLCAMIGLAMCPWKLLESSNQFTTYLSAYTVFLSSIAGVIASDYYIVRKGYLSISDLYSFDKTSVYMATYGLSWRGFAAYVSGILINVVGFAGAVGADVPIGATYVYNLSYFTGFFVAMIVYYILCKFWPPRLTKDKWSELSVEEVEEVLGFSTGYEGQKPNDITDDFDKKDDVTLKIYSV
jgi:NCS1 family nucleobase:cation symporter-1